MERLSSLVRRFVADPRGLRESLVPGVLFWKSAPVEANPELIWQTLSGSRTDAGPHDPAVFPLRKAPDRSNAFNLGITLGRALNNDVAIEHASVSRFHAYLQLSSSGEWLVFDADSSNGTFCDGVRVPKGTGLPLRDNSTVRVGDVALQLYLPATFEALFLSGR